MSCLAVWGVVEHETHIRTIAQSEATAFPITAREMVEAAEPLESAVAPVGLSGQIAYDTA